MGLDKGKLTIAEIEGSRCVIIEKQVSKERVDFLANLLQLNNIPAKILEVLPKKEEDPITYTLGVADVTFNPVLAVYQRRLKTPTGKKVTPDYWNQKTEELQPNYWNLDLKTT